MSRAKNKLIEQICKGKPLFIKNTGIRVEVDYFGTDMHKFRSRNSKEDYCQVNMLDPPTIKSLKMFEKFHIKMNSHSKEMELEGTIKLSNLSIMPYETEAARVLYEKKKGNK